MITASIVVVAAVVVVVASKQIDFSLKSNLLNKYEIVRQQGYFFNQKTFLQCEGEMVRASRAEPVKTELKSARDGLPVD